MTKKRMLIILIALVLLLAAGLAVYRSRQSGLTGLTGSRVKNPDSYTLDVQQMNGTDSHTLELEAGGVLQVDFDIESGSMRLEIKAPDGTALYAGNGTQAPHFTLNIPESGAYSLTVEAHRFRGRLDIQAKSAA